MWSKHRRKVPLCSIGKGGKTRETFVGDVDVDDEVAKSLVKIQCVIVIHTTKYLPVLLSMVSGRAPLRLTQLEMNIDNSRQR
jgi:hypothetical protein